MDFLKRLVGISTSAASSGGLDHEYQENMDDAYRSRGKDPEEEAQSEMIWEILNSSNNSNKAEASSEDKLARLAKLNEQGTITDAEYEQIRQELEQPG